MAVSTGPCARSAAASSTALSVTAGRACQTPRLSPHDILPFTRYDTAQRLWVVDILRHTTQRRQGKTTRAKVLAVSVVAIALLASGCAGEKNIVEQKTGTAGSGSASPSAAGPTKAAGSLVSSGFGQKDEYVWVTSLVHNDSDKVGQTVTVQFNAKDAAGALVKSTSQVENFSRVGQDLAVGTQINAPKDVKIATVEATLLIEDHGAFSSEPFPEMKTTPVTVVADPYGGSTANFELSNPTDQPVKSPRLGIICYDAANTIIGGGMDFPNLVPPSGKVAVEAHILTTGTPASCKAFAGGPM
jgi:hypothetical protein